MSNHTTYLFTSDIDPSGVYENYLNHGQKNLDDTIGEYYLNIPNSRIKLSDEEFNYIVKQVVEDCIELGFLKVSSKYKTCIEQINFKLHISNWTNESYLELVASLNDVAIASSEISYSRNEDILLALKNDIMRSYHLRDENGLERLLEAILYLPV